MAVDVAAYALSAATAAWLALVTAYHGHRVWGVSAALGYLLAAAASALLLTRGAAVRGRPALRRLPAAVAGLGAVAVPLALLVHRRAAGAAWSAQPEVGVVEAAAAALLAAGTPYPDVAALGRPPGFEDYVPYLPGMAVFGVPRALAGAPVGLPAAAPPPAAAWTDPRLWFAASGALLLAAAVAVLRRRGARAPSLRAVQLVVLAPPTALALCTGGDDVPVLGLLVLAHVLAHVDRPGLAGVAGGVALALKLSAAPALLVLAVAVHARRGPGAARRAAAGALAVAATVVAPVAVRAPGELVEHVLRYPAGLAAVASPARSPLPGYLLAATGPAGRVAALVLLGAAALGLLTWVVRHPPADAAGAAARSAAAMAVAMLLLPATRIGYLVYPLALLGTAVLLRDAGPAAERLNPSRR